MENGMKDSEPLKVNRRELAWIWFQGLSMGKSPQELKDLLVSSSKKWQSSLSPMARRLIEIEGPPSGDWVAFKSEGKAGSSHALLGREELRLERGSWQVFLRTCLRDRLTLITLPQSEGLQEVLNAMPVIGIKGARRGLKKDEVVGAVDGGWEAVASTASGIFKAKDSAWFMVLLPMAEGGVVCVPEVGGGVNCGVDEVESGCIDFKELESEFGLWGVFEKEVLEK